MWYLRAGSSPPGNDGNPSHNVLGITSIADGHPKDHCNPTYHLQLSHPMDYGTSPQHQNDEPHHTVTTLANGGIPGLSIPAIYHPTLPPPPTPCPRPATGPQDTHPNLPGLQRL